MYRKISLKKVYKSSLVRFIASLVLIFIFGTVAVMAYSDGVVTDLSSNMIRLHVVANSDSADDQQLKLLIRDKIIAYMQDDFSNSKSIDDSRNAIKSNLNAIEDIANREIQKAGKNYKATAKLGYFDFPVKKYGDITLPPGTYEALRVELGSASGQNWWCVLFPPLCFVDATHGTVSPEMKEKLKNQLTTEEYQIITTADSEEDVPINIKFKIIEVFENSRIKVAGAFNDILKMVRGS